MTSLPYYASWPNIQSSITRDETQEKEIADIVEQMTLEEKIGQMIQPNLRDVTPEEAKQYKLGSLLNGGGTWVNDDKYATALDWAKESDKYWFALEEAYADRPFSIPFMWASDAVHGHNNIFKATLFPHNIGLGAARDPDLIYRIGRATALEVAATGMDWTFAPTVATPRNLHWGRAYEGYSEDPEIVYNYAGKMVEGLQGDQQELQGYEHVLSNVKHWIGDGGTLGGIDRGDNAYTEEHLINIHAMGYFSGLAAGAQVVMSSFSGWKNEKNTSHDGSEYNQKLSGSHYLLTQVLKEKIGFDGIVISDWNSHSEVSACEDDNANYSINAGLDILMITARNDWKGAFEHAVAGVKSGEIAIERINDAVTRILRVKMRAGLWQKQPPSHRPQVLKKDVLGCPSHKELAREAVRKSLVLLKNNRKNNHIKDSNGVEKEALLPLSRNQKILIAGSAADDIQKHTGGWSITWQGSDNSKSDFPGCLSLTDAIRETIGADNLEYFTSEKTESICNIAIVAIGEDPYAEVVGDIKSWQTLEYSKIKRSYEKDLEIIRTLKQQGKTVITVFFSGRPLHINEEINLSDAVVAAWLPGTESLGITDVLFKNENDTVNYDFQGKLSFSWPLRKNDVAVNRIPPNLPNYQVPECEQDPREALPLFPYGYGLSYALDDEAASALPHDYDLNDLPIEKEEDKPELKPAEQALELFGIMATGDYVLHMADSNNWLTGKEISGNNDTICEGIKSTPIDYQHQQDGRRITAGKKDTLLYLQTQDKECENLAPYLLAEGTLDVAIKIIQKPEVKVHLAFHRDVPNSPSLDITERLNSFPLDEWQTLAIPLSEFDELGCNFEHINTPFLLFSEGSFIFELGSIRWSV